MLSIIVIISIVINIFISIIPILSLGDVCFSFFKVFDNFFVLFVDFQIFKGVLFRFGQQQTSADPGSA